MQCLVDVKRWAPVCHTVNKVYMYSSDARNCLDCSTVRRRLLLPPHVRSAPVRGTPPTVPSLLLDRRRMRRKNDILLPSVCLSRDVQDIIAAQRLWADLVRRCDVKMTAASAASSQYSSEASRQRSLTAPMRWECDTVITVRLKGTVFTRTVFTGPFLPGPLLPTPGYTGTSPSTSVREYLCINSKYVKSHVFLKFEKIRKNMFKNVRIVSEATNHSTFNYTITASQYR